MPETSIISASCGHSPAALVVTASILSPRITIVAPACGPAPVPSISVPPSSTFISALPANARSLYTTGFAVSSSAFGTRVAAIGDHRREAGMCRGLLFSLVLGCLWLAGPAAAQESLLDTVLKRDKLIVATYSTSPPLAYVDDSGKLVGFEI